MRFFGLAAAAAVVSALPTERQDKSTVLPLSHVNNVKSMKSLVEKGQARINGINKKNAVGPTAQVSSGSVTNEDVTYVAPVSVGGYTRSLIVDTGCMYISR